MSVLNIKYPDLASMFSATPSSGAETEGRQHRKGAGSMKLSTYARYHKIENVRRRMVQRPEIPNFPLAEYSYEVTVRTFPLLDSLGPIKRYDALGFWELSFNEILRHLALAGIFTGSTIWEQVLSVIQSYRPEIIEVLEKYFSAIMSRGNFNIDHFRMYVKEHEDSSTPFGGKFKWSYFLENEGALKVCHERTNRAIKDFAENWTKYIRQDAIYVKPEFTYPALRARPGDATVLAQDNDITTVLIRKWRDRKAGGMPIYSQVTYPVYHEQTKKDVERPVYEWMRKVLGCEIHSLSQDGPKVYKDCIDYGLHTYDMKTAEKQTGLAFNWLPFTVDLGYNIFPADLSGEMYSGIGPTTQLNEIMMCMLLKTMIEEYDIHPSHVAMFGDNLGIDIELPETPHFDKAEAFCGFMVDKQRFGPVSLSTDNPKHRLVFPNATLRQVQIQNIQYGMRPLLSVVMNGVADSRSSVKFLDFVIDNEIFKYPEFSSGPKSSLEEAILEDNVVHEKFIDAFSEDMKWVENWFPVQFNNPEFVSDFRVF